MSNHTSTGRAMRARALTRRPLSGQALVTTLLFGAVACLAMLFLFNGALLANTKTQLQNAADAGAYSAAILQARDHNYSAYTNRSMIANQVAVAQAVSMESYLEDADWAVDRSKNWLHDWWQRGFTTNGTFWDAAIKAPMSTTRSVMSGIDKPLIIALNLLIDALDESQEINHLGTMADMMLVADEVVKQNDAKARVTTSAFMLGDAAIRVTKWGNDYTKRHSANDSSKEADRFADAVVHEDSLDSWTPNRMSAPNAVWASDVSAWRCPLSPSSFTMWAYAHGGGTKLSANKKRWMALDATQGGGFAICHYPCPILGDCPITFPFFDTSLKAPWNGGHGGAQVGNSGGYEWSGYKNNPWSTAGYGGAFLVATIPAGYRFWKGPGVTLDTNGGIQDHYRDISATTSKPANQSAAVNGGQYPVTIEVEHGGIDVRTTTKFMTDNKQLKLEDGMKSNTMRTIASASAYFYRSRQNSGFTRSGWQRGDNRTEYENLFSPYWQARLIPSDKAEAAASLLAQ